MTPGPARRAMIVGTGRAVPERIVTNKELERRVDTTDAWIVERTGIRQRHIAGPEEHNSDLAAAAARAALEAAGVEATELDLILLATVTADRLLPSASALVQAKIGARCPAVDLQAACAGFIYGLTMARGQIESGLARHVLLIGVEVLSRWVDWDDRTTCVLFGDGAGAVVLAPGEGCRGVIGTHIAMDGRLAQALYVEAGGTALRPTPEVLAEGRQHIKMNGREIFKSAVKHIAAASLRVASEAGWALDEIDWIIPHQANQRIIDAVSRRLGVGLDRFFINIERYGNTSSASIPIALDEARRCGALVEGQRVVISALGAGLAWGAAAIRW